MGGDQMAADATHPTRAGLRIFFAVFPAGGEPPSTKRSEDNRPIPAGDSCPKPGRLTERAAAHSLRALQTPAAPYVALAQRPRPRAFLSGLDDVVWLVRAAGGG